ncbi:MAG: OmpA family protein [Deltaproteobacteria bacterium]|nr:OmpA family protein [Deltaproteobacteria bacterium]
MSRRSDASGLACCVRDDGVDDSGGALPCRPLPRCSRAPECPARNTASVVVSGCVDPIKPRVRFATGAWKLDASARALIDDVAKTLRDVGHGRVLQVIGNADLLEAPSKQAAQALSEKRAKAVAARLIELEVPASQLRIIGNGSDRPVAPNQTEKGRAQNRSVEFELEPEPAD